MASGYKLTEGALEAIMNGGTITEPIVQILGSKKMMSCIQDNERYRLLISDGKFKVNIGMYSVKSYTEDVTHLMEPYSIIKLKRYLSNVIKNKDKRDTRVLLILDLELVVRGSAVGYIIGKPITLLDNEVTMSQSSNVSNISNCEASPSKNVSAAPRLNRKISPISSLNPFHNNWVIRARVVNKTNIRNWSNARGEGKLFSCDLVDQSGEIRCTAFRELVDKYFDLLEVDKVYYISKCLLQPINRQFCNLKHEFEMTFTPVTEIEESSSNNECIPQIKYNLTTLDKVAVMEPGTIVDVIAICKTNSDLVTFTSKSTNRELKKREVLLTDQSKIGISLILWGNDAECFTMRNNPVLLIKGLKICEFQGSKNLTLIQGSQLKVNPKISDTNKLKTWFDLEGNHVEIKNISLRSGFGGQSRWLTFKEVQQLESRELEKGVYFQTVGTIILVRLDRAVYKSCPNQDCLKKVTDLENGMYRCEKCNREFPNFKYRLLVSMNISDSSCNQWVTVFSSEAEKILGKPSQEIGEAMETDQDSVAKIFEEAQFKQFLFRCRAKLENFNDEQKLKVMVLGVSDVNFEEHNNYLLKRIENLCGIPLN